MRKITLLILLIWPHMQLTASHQSPYKNWALVGGIVGLIGTGISAWSYKLLEKEYRVQSDSLEKDLRQPELRCQAVGEAVDNALDTINIIDQDHTKQDKNIEFIEEQIASIELAGFRTTLSKSLKDLKQHTETCGHCHANSVSINANENKCDKKQRQLILLAMSFKDTKLHAEERLEMHKEYFAQHKSPRYFDVREKEEKKNRALKKTAGLGLLTATFFSSYWWLTKK